MLLLGLPVKLILSQSTPLPANKSLGRGLSPAAALVANELIETADGSTSGPLSPDTAEVPLTGDETSECRPRLEPEREPNIRDVGGVPDRPGVPLILARPLVAGEALEAALVGAEGEAGVMVLSPFWSAFALVVLPLVASGMEEDLSAD